MTSDQFYARAAAMKSLEDALAEHTAARSALAATPEAQRMAGADQRLREALVNAAETGVTLSQLATVLGVTRDTARGRLRAAKAAHGKDTP